jgi:hypothetical protein
MTIVLSFQIGNVKGAEETVKTAKALDIREESHIVQFTYRYCIRQVTYRYCIRQGCGSESAWIRNKVKIWELQRLTMEPWRAVGSHSGGVEAQNGALEGLELPQWRRGSSKWSTGGPVDNGGRRFASLLMRSMIRIRIRMNMKIRIRIRFKVKHGSGTALK